MKRVITFLVSVGLLVAVLLLVRQAESVTASSDLPQHRVDPSGVAAQPAGAVDMERIDAMLATMSLQDKLGQMLMSYPPLDRVGSVWVGGVVLTGNLLKDSESVRARVADLQARARVPLLVAADVEGGEFNRLDFLPGLETIPSARELGAMPLDQVEEWGFKVGNGMHSLGINLNLAPVLDLAGTGMMFETGRSMGTEPDRVADCAAAYARGLGRAGVLAIGKHFPGYGDLASNTDYHLLVRSTTREQMETEIRAFDLARQSLAGVMLSNVGYSVYGGKPAIITSTLVDRARGMGWLTVTDDLAIGALVDAVGGDAAELLREAYRAGNDVLLTTAPPDWDKGLDYLGVLEAMARDEPAAMADLDERVRRILGVKGRLGLLPASP